MDRFEAAAAKAEAAIHSFVQDLEASEILPDKEAEGLSNEEYKEIWRTISHMLVELHILRDKGVDVHRLVTEGFLLR